VVHVVVPARDEEQFLPRHLESLRAAAGVVRRTHPAVTVRATVVLDSCTDDSMGVLSRHPWVDVATVESGVVGEVRARGVTRAREQAVGAPAQGVWIACTDADTVVPPNWLVAQLALAATGSELVVGTVLPDAADLPPPVLAAWEARHSLREGHTHVHGANMGFTLAAYDLVGGFEPVESGEDVRLVVRMQQAGVAWSATAKTQVITSGRRLGRVDQGFSSYLMDLAP
jgi:hypothetical protein